MAIIAFRFVVRMQLGETAGWISFAFLQVGGPQADKTAHLWKFELCASHLSILLPCSLALHACCTPHSSPPIPSQIYPRTFIGDQSMYDKAGWQLLVKGWEAAVYNPGAAH